MYLTDEELDKLYSDYNITLSEEDLDDACFMATQYESGGVIDKDKIAKEFFAEHGSEYEDELVSDYRDWCEEHNLGDDLPISWEEFEEYLSHLKPEDAFNLGFFADRSIFSGGYVKFDGYNNVKSAESLDLDYILDNAKDDFFKDEFIKLFSEDDLDAIRDGALILVELGY